MTSVSITFTIVKAPPAFIKMIVSFETWWNIAISAGVVLSAVLVSFLLSRFTFKRLLKDNSKKRIGLLSWLTTAILTPAILYLILYLVFTPQFSDLKDYVDGWEIKTSYQIYPSKTISIVDNSYKLNRGENNVLIVSREITPIAKPGQTEPTDLRSIRTLIIELSQADTFVTPNTPGSSNILRGIFAFSPNYGISPLQKEEQIEIRRKGRARWAIDSHLIDFQFKGEFSSRDSSKVTSKYVDKW